MKPVPAGHTVAGPIVEIFMGYHSFYTLKRLVGLSERIGQHTGGIKYIQALILHGPHVEVVNGNNHKDV